jgi:hypothetical protein
VQALLNKIENFEEALRRLDPCESTSVPATIFAGSYVNVFGALQLVQPAVSLSKGLKQPPLCKGLVQGLRRRLDIRHPLARLSKAR